MGMRPDKNMGMRPARTWNEASKNMEWGQTRTWEWDQNKNMGMRPDKNMRMRPEQEHENVRLVHTWHCRLESPLVCWTAGFSSCFCYPHNRSSEIGKRGDLLLFTEYTIHDKYNHKNKILQYTIHAMTCSSWIPWTCSPWQPWERHSFPTWRKGKVGNYDSLCRQLYGKNGGSCNS